MNVLNLIGLMLALAGMLAFGASVIILLIDIVRRMKRGGCF